MRLAGLVVLVVSLWLSAVSTEAQENQPVAVTLPPLGSSKPPRDPGGFARGAAIYGTISAALMFGGSIAIAAVDDLESERITRGVWVGMLTFSTPFVALGGWTARKRTGVQGYKAVRLLGWTSWSFALTNAILQYYEVMHDDESQHWGLTVGLGAVSVMATLPVAFDAFASARRASSRHHFVRLRLGPLSIRGEF